MSETSDGGWDPRLGRQTSRLKAGHGERPFIVEDASEDGGQRPM